jgi:hypothetical protein
MVSDRRAIVNYDSEGLFEGKLEAAFCSGTLLVAE